jgi:hypothetical protein
MVVVLALCSLVLVILAGVWPALAFAESGTGTLSGVALDASGTAVSGMEVYLYHAESAGVFDPFVRANTSADGSFAFVGIAPGSYKLKCWDPANHLIDGWYGDAGSGPSTFTVDAGAICMANLTFVRGAAYSGPSRTPITLEAEH